MTEVIVATITSLATLIGVIVAQVVGYKKTAKEAKAQSDLIAYRIGELEKKQDKYNDLIRRTFKLEERTEIQEEKLKVANHRIDDLERKTA